MSHALDSIFRPKSVALIGASRDPRSMSGTLLLNLAGSFRGPIYAVNPHAAEIAGLPVYPSIADIPGEIDLAIIAVPAKHVLRSVEECLARHVGGMVIISAGFAETGAAGEERSRQVWELVRQAGIPVVGPNCLGILNATPGAALNATFGTSIPPAGSVAACSQSGALGFVFPEYIRQWRLGISQFASIGNKLVVGENELVEYWGSDPGTRVIQLYLESFENPRRFLEVARHVSRIKPIIALKAGTTTAGQRAAASHTAALASQDAAAEGLLRQAGVIRVTTLEELFEGTALLATQPLPRGRRVAVLTNAGGPAVLCVDALAAGGLLVPELSAGLQSQFREFLPEEATVRNPIDLIGSTDPDWFRRCLNKLLTSGEVDAVVVIFIPRLPGASPAIAQVIRECAEADESRRTLVSVFMQSDPPAEELAKEPCAIPVFGFPEGAARALRVAVNYSETRARPPGMPAVFSEINADELRRIAFADREPRIGEPGWLAPDAMQRLLSACRLTVPAWRVVRSLDEAEKAAAAIGFPLAIKVISPTITHKTDVGGVVLNVCDADGLEAAFHRVSGSVPDAVGVLVQRMAPDGIDLFIGAQRDSAFGHLIGFGRGGILVESLGDVRFRLHPLTDRDADELIQESPIAPLLRARRGLTASDIKALQEVLLKVSALVSAVPELRELDLNPVRVLPMGRGINVLDARLLILLPSHS